MKFVLDASTAIRVVVPEALGGAYAEDVMRLLERRGKPVCPQTWRAEVASGLHQAYLAKKISEAAARAALRRLQALPIEFADAPAPTALFELQIKHAISAYDAMYVAIAQRRKLKIATHDSKLARNLVNRGMSDLLLSSSALPKDESA